MISTTAGALECLAAFDENAAKVIRVAGPFNPARLLNSGAKTATGEILCFLSDDLVAPAGWLDEMLGRITEKDVGAVGAMVLWPDGIVQHGGIVLGPSFSAVHAFEDRMEDDCGYGGLLGVAHECSAVSAACLATRRSDFMQVGGMNEDRFALNFGDVDYCLKLRALGRRIVFTPHARFVRDSHPATRAAPPDRAALRGRALQSLRAKWGDALGADPYYSPVLSLDAVPFSALAWPVPALTARINAAPVANHIPTMI